MCEPNPCEHGGKCTTITSNEFSCNCSSTGYEGRTCNRGVIDKPDIPTLVVGVPTESLEFRASPPDNYVILRPSSPFINFNPPSIIFKNNISMRQSLTMTAQQSGLHHVKYRLFGPGAAGFEIPESSAFFAESARDIAQNISKDTNTELKFPSGRCKLELDKCPRSDVRITAYSTSPWLMLGSMATTEGQVSLRTGNVELPYSMTGSNFDSEESRGLDLYCEQTLSETFSVTELIKRKALIKTFLKVVRHSLPTWLDIGLRDDVSFSSMVETDLQAYYLSGKNLREEANIKGQPLSEDTFFSLLLSPDLDVTVNGDRVSFAEHDRRARFSIALELCGPPPNDVILRPSPGSNDVLNQLSIMKQLRDKGWKFKIDSLQISNSSFAKPGVKQALTLFAKFTKEFDISDTVKLRVNFRGTIIANVHNLNQVCVKFLAISFSKS